MSRSPASSTSRAALLGDETSAWTARAADLRATSAGLVGAGAVAEHDLRAGARELDDDRAADPARAAGDERRLPLEGAEARSA